MAASKAKSIALMMLRPKGGGNVGPDGDAVDSAQAEDAADGGADDGLEGAMGDLRAAMSEGRPEDMAAAFRAAMDAAQG